MRKDKKEAVELRKLGKSYSEIKKELGVPKSTLSEWFSNLDWSQEIAEKRAEKAIKENTIRIKKLNKVRGKKLDKLYAQARKEAEEDFKKLKLHPLFVAGVMLYWGEGDKSENGPVRISNTDPGMIKAFYHFLKHVCGIKDSDISAYVLLYPELKEKECKEYWIKNTDLSVDHFTKSVVIEGRHETRRLDYGVCNLHTSSKYLKEKIKVWIDLFSEELPV